MDSLNSHALLDFLTLSETGTVLRLSKATIARRVKDGSIPTIRIGGRRLVPASFIATLTASAKGGLQC